MREPVEMTHGVVMGPELLDPEQRNRKPEPRYTSFCKWCGELKMNGLFTPSQLTKTNPKCRACIYEYQSRDYARPGVKAGYGWRTPFFPERLK